MTISKRKTSYYAISIDTMERVISMSQWTDMYKQKLMTPEEAVKVVKSGDWVDYGMGYDPAGSPRPGLGSPAGRTAGRKSPHVSFRRSPSNH